jgi:hypothetical protein
MSDPSQEKTKDSNGRRRSDTKKPSRFGLGSFIEAEDTGLEPATGHPAIDFESTC